MWHLESFNIKNGGVTFTPMQPYFIIGFNIFNNGVLEFVSMLDLYYRFKQQGVFMDICENEYCLVNCGSNLTLTINQQSEGNTIPLASSFVNGNKNIDWKQLDFLNYNNCRTEVADWKKIIPIFSESSLGFEDVDSDVFIILAVANDTESNMF